MFGSGYENCPKFGVQVVLILSLIFCKQEDYCSSGAFQVAPASYQTTSRGISSVIVMKTQISNLVRNNLVRNNHRNEFHQNKIIFILQYVSSESDCRRLSSVLKILFFFNFVLSVRRKPNCIYYVLLLKKTIFKESGIFC